MAKGNKRFINALCKRLNISISWKGVTSLGYEVAEIETQSDYSFHELIEFVGSMNREFSTIDDQVHMDLENITNTIASRRDRFNKSYGKLFDQMKRENNGTV